MEQGSKAQELGSLPAWGRLSLPAVQLQWARLQQPLKAHLSQGPVTPGLVLLL